MKTDLFQSCGHSWVFQICWHVEWSTLLVLSFRILNSSPPLALFLVILPKGPLDFTLQDVFLYFFAVITEEDFLISPCYSLDLYIQVDIFFLSPLPFAFLRFSAICKSSSHNHFAFLHFFFLGMVLITASCTVSQTSVHSSSGTLSFRYNPLNLFVTSTVTWI